LTNNGVSVKIFAFFKLKPKNGFKKNKNFPVIEPKKVGKKELIYTASTINVSDLIIVRQNYAMFIGVGNHEHRNMMYTIETWTVLTEFNNLTNSTSIMAMDPIDHLSLTLADNITTIISYNLSLYKTGYNRVEFLLFNETVPGPDVIGSDRINASYRDLYLRVNVKDIEYQEPSN
jgi:hypothetical protein